MATTSYIGKSAREILHNTGWTDEMIRVTVKKAKRGKRVQTAIDTLNKGLNKAKGMR